MKSRGVLIAGNWKMNLGPRSAERFMSEVAAGAADLAASGSPLARGTLKTWVIPPFVSLEAALRASAKFPFPVTVAAQNAHWEKTGAFTGEISGPMLQEIGDRGGDARGIKHVLVGHSERRQYFGETDQTVQKRAISLLQQGFQVILCIGETKTERERGATFEVLSQQLREALVVGSANGGTFLDGRLILAYEPVWAIGTGVTAKPEQAEEAHQMIRKFIWDHFGMESAGRTPILYGGSVTPENADSLLGCANIDGALVGGASIKVESYLALLRAGAKAAQSG